MQARFFYFMIVFFVLTTGVSPVGLRTTSAVQLTDADIARMNAEATAAGSQFRGLGAVGKLASVAKASVKAVTNPFTTIYSLVAPLGMFTYGFVEQAFRSIKNTDYMGSTLSIMVDPKAQWTKLVKSEKEAVKKLVGLTAAQPAATTATTATAAASATAQGSSATAAPTISDLEASGWVAKYKAGPVGLVYDFGFAGAGDDLSQPFGFLRSVSTGKYYYRPVRGQMSPQSMPIEGKSYAVDFRQRPFSVLVPKLMLSLIGEKVATPIWNTMLDFTQLDPIKIFVFKSVLLFSSAIKNSFKRVETKTADVGQVYTKESWGAYRSVDKGGTYPTLQNIHTELAKLVQRLKVTPDVKRTIKANGGQTLPSKWDPARIVYLGDVNPGLILLSVLPSDLKTLLNLMFKVNVNFYEFQAAIDAKNKLRPSDIELFYGHVRSYGSSADALAKMQAAGANGGYVDEYILQLQELQGRISSIVWKGGSQTFTDMMKLFFLLRWMLKDVYSGIEFIISKYEQPTEVLERAVTVNAGMTSDTSVEDSGMQDQSVQPEAVLGDVYSRTIDFNLLTEKVLKERVAALKKYAVFVRTYVNSFLANAIGDASIDARYVRPVPSADLSSFSVESGGPDDISTYFSPAMMKKTLKDYVTVVGKEADAVAVTIDAEIGSFESIIARASDAARAFNNAQADGVAPASSIVSAMTDTADDFISELRKRVSANQEFGVYPLGYDERYLKTVELPGAVYLAYCLNYQTRLLSRPFEGDALYSYNDSFYDNDSSYMYLLSALMRANEDLSRAGAVVSTTNGPVVFKDGDGKPVVVPNGAEFYLNSLKKYDQYMLLKEQDLRKVEAEKGRAGAEYAAASAAYLNARKLLLQKKFEMNNLLRSFEFDRRKGAMYTPPLTVSNAQALSLVGKAENVLQNTSVPSASTAASAGSLAPLVGVAPEPSAASQVAPAVVDTSLDVKFGIVGRLADGSPVYSYERSVAGFLQAEFARFAFRSNMLKLDDLKELVFAVTGIQAEDLWVGVENKKRNMFFAQQAAAAAARPVVSTAVADEKASLDELLSADDLPGLAQAQGDVAEEPTVAGDSGEVSSGGDNVVSGGIASAGAGAAEALPPIPPIDASGNVVAMSVNVTASLALTKRPASLVQAIDLDEVVFAAGSQGKSSFNDAAGITQLNGKLADLFAQGQAAATAQDGQLFTAYVVKILGLVSQALDPSDDVKRVFVSGLQSAMSLLAFDGEPTRFADVNSFDNLLEVVTYLKAGALASQSAALSVMEEQLNSWLRSH